MYFKPSVWFLAVFWILIAALHAWSLLNAGYFYIWWLDVLLHFLGGLWLGSIAIFFLAPRLEQLRLNPFFVFVVLISLVALGGILWEFFEYGYDLAIGRKGLGPIAQPGVDDTMADLFLDLLGGALAYFLFRKKPSSLL